MSSDSRFFQGPINTEFIDDRVDDCGVGGIILPTTKSPRMVFLIENIESMIKKSFLRYV
jgi:hypothetical protein